jgi:hypothetical protein
MVRRLLTVAAVLACAGVLSAPSFGARPGGLPHSVSSAHFVVHYTSDPDDEAYTTQTKAADLAALGERAYAAFKSWGFSTPADDGDGKVDVYIADLSGLSDPPLAYADTDVVAATSTGYIVFDVKSLDRSDENLTIAHELFHVVQFTSWGNAQASDAWLFEGSAQWAAAKAYDFPASLTNGLGPSDLSLDCRDSIGSFQKCSPDAYIDGGYSRWPFFQSLAARYGASFVQSVFLQGQTGVGATGALAAAIGAKGGSLGDVFGDWSVQQMTGTYGIPTLDAKAPTTYGTTMIAGTATGPLAAQKISVDHLATRYVKFTRGDGAGDHPCFAATLTITVILPAGVAARPFFYWNQKGSTAVPLVVNGSTASATVPWDTCLWASNVGYLSLPNPSTNVDAADFVVGGTLTVDPNTPATATSAPTPSNVYGGVTQVPSVDQAPTIALYGPLLLRVSTKAPTLRLIVQSSGEGKLHATLGSLDLGTPALRAGNNDLRFKLPNSFLSALRRSSAAKNVLTLTPVSSSGAAGPAVTRRVTLAKK